MPAQRLSRFILLPELNLTKAVRIGPWATQLFVEKNSPLEVCPKCAQPSKVIYDRRWATIKDEPIRGKGIFLKIRKRRFYCKPCNKPFTEPIPGIAKSARTTRRFKQSLLWACENFSDMKKVRKAYRCSNNMLYKSRYEELHRKDRERKTQVWPKTIGLDEHAWKRSKRYGGTQYVTMVVDHGNRKLAELVEGKSVSELKASLEHIAGRERVQHVTLDLADPYASFTKEFFPNAKLVADKFHVLRLLTPVINRYRKEVTGDKRSLPIRRLLLCNGSKLDKFVRLQLQWWLEDHKVLKEVYLAKESLHRIYRIKGHRRASRALTKLTDELAKSEVPELKTLRKTLMKWRDPILNYHRTRLTNARVEGYNNVAKTIKKRAYGIKSFKNYRLLLRNACC